MSDRAVTKPLRMAYRALFSCLSSSCQQQQRNYGQAAVRDAYKVLGLKTNASLGEVKAAYRRLALKWFVPYLILGRVACDMNV